MQKIFIPKREHINNLLNLYKNKLQDLPKECTVTTEYYIGYYRGKMEALQHILNLIDGE